MWSDLDLTASYVKALLLGGSPGTGTTNPNALSDLGAFDEESLREVVTEGRRQLDHQSESFRHATDRGQLLLTVTLVAIGFEAATFGKITGTSSAGEIVALILWLPGFVVTLLGLAAAGAVVAVKATFDRIDTTQVSGWKPPILRQLAADYASAVRQGEETVADRVTVFRQATRFTVWGSMLASVALVVALAAPGADSSTSGTGSHQGPTAPKGVPHHGRPRLGSLTRQGRPSGPRLDRSSMPASSYRTTRSSNDG